MGDTMRRVVITGSTRGFGYGLAEAFLQRGCAVTLTSRTATHVEEAERRAAAHFAPERILGQVCDVREYEQIRDLWNAAHDQFGGVDIWINNAGTGHNQVSLWEHSPEEMHRVVETNLVGLLNGVKVAVPGMLSQGQGAVYNVEGLGSDGRREKGLALYGSTKRAVRYLTESLVREVEGTGVLAGALSPGMMVTNLLTDPYEEGTERWERAKRIFNILADRVETVAPWMADRVLANTRNGARIRWLTRRRMITRFLLAPFRQRDLFDDQ